MNMPRASTPSVKVTQGDKKQSASFFWTLVMCVKHPLTDVKVESDYTLV